MTILTVIQENEIKINVNFDSIIKINRIHSSTASLAYEWDKPYQTEDSEYIYGIDVDASENIYITGTSNNVSTPNIQVVYTAKYDLNGNSLWNISTNYIANSSRGEKIVINSGTYYITGSLTYDNGGIDSLFALGDSMGAGFLNYTWGVTNKKEYGYDICLDKFGNKYITGESESGGNSDAFLIKYNNSNQYQWNVSWGFLGTDIAKGVAVDDSGNIYIVGYTNSFGSFDSFIAKYNSLGFLIWNHTWGGLNMDGAYDVVLDKVGNIYMTGFTNSFKTGFYDIFIVKYNSNGNYEWYTLWGYDDGDIAYGITIDDSGKIYIGGDTTSNGIKYNAFVVIFDTNKNLVAEKIWDSGSSVRIRSIAVYSSSIYLAGWTDKYTVGNIDGIIIKFKETEIVVDDDDDDNNEGNETIQIQDEKIIYIFFIIIISSVFTILIFRYLFKIKERRGEVNRIKNDSIIE